MLYEGSFHEWRGECVIMKLLRKYNYLIIILVFCAILYISYSSYDRTKEIIKSKYVAQSSLVESSVINALENANRTYSISEKILNDEMKYYSKILLDEYKDNPEIMTWNLNELKSKMNDYHIYIIDSNLIVKKTTFDKDLGMNFSKYPSFAKLLRSRLEGNTFVADKMDVATNTGELRKYSYMPTPDNKYLIELSIDIADRYSILKELNIFSLSRNLIEKYQSVEGIIFYKFSEYANSVGIIKDEKDPINTDVSNQDKSLVKEAVVSNAIKSRIINGPDFTTTYKYIPILATDKDGENDWWNSFVIRITYNNKEMLNEINKETNSFLINISIIAIVFMGFIAVMVYLLRKTEHMAYHDHLTGLPNRKAFEKYFHEILGKKERKIAILYLDLDDFKYVNDNYGHEFGDKLLTEVGMRLKNILRGRDRVSRVGGDEFVIMLNDINSKRDVSLVVAKLEKQIKKPFNLDCKTIEINCSIGTSIYPEQGSTLGELINEADSSMYRMKNEKC